MRKSCKQIFRINRLFKIFILFAVYYATARFGLNLGAVSKFATFVWPPMGIDLAALLIFDFDLWPGIALAAFFVNWSLGAEVRTSFVESDLRTPYKI